MKYQRAHILIVDDVPEIEVRRIIDSYNQVRSWAFVHHSRHINGEIVKPHFHIYVELICSVDVLALASVFNVHPSQIQPVISKASLIKYLVSQSSLYDIQASFNVATAIGHK